MPRYYFDTIDGRTNIDADGELLDDDAAAREVAIRIVSELGGTRAASIWAGEIFQIVTRDESRQTVGLLTVTGRWPVV